MSTVTAGTNGIESDQMCNDRNEALKPNGGTLLSAIVSCMTKAHPSSWEFEMNVLNLKKAFIKEIGNELHLYSMKIGLASDQLADLLTHWHAVEHVVDIEACHAIAKVLKRDIIIFEKEAHQLFKGSEGFSLEPIVIERGEGGSFRPRKSEERQPILESVR